MQNKIYNWLLKMLKAQPIDERTLFTFGDYGFWLEGLQEFLVKQGPDKWHKIEIIARADKDYLDLRSVIVSDSVQAANREYLNIPIEKSDKSK